MQKIGTFIFMCLLTTVCWAQKISVSGVVFDDLGPLPGTSVVVKGSQADQLVGTITDFDGKFVLSVNPNDVLVFSFLGYISKEVAVSGKTDLSVELQSESTELDQVVVVGYGVQKKASSVASISQTKGEDLLKVGSVTTISEGLQGMMPGITAVSTNGKPGADEADIFIRGKASWNDTDPLVLVDGIERSMNDVDPNEIESVSVLKDASATAVFGVRGGNGVILITTKRGQVSKPKVSFSANFGFKQPTTGPEFSDYVTAMEMWNEAQKNDKQWDDLIPESKIEAWRNAYATGNYGPYNDYFPEVNWRDEMVKDFGYQQQYNVNVNGGTEFMKYFVSLGYLNDDDIYNTKANEIFDPSFRYQRYNWRSNLDFSITPTTEFSVNLAGKVGYRNQPGYRIDGGATEDGNGQEQFFNAFYSADQNSFPIMWSDGEYGSSSTGGGNLMLAFDKGQRIYKYYEGFLDFKLKQKLDFITKGLSAKASVSYNSESDYTSRKQRYEGGNFGQNHITYSREYDYANPNEDGTYNIISEGRWENELVQETPPYAVYDLLMKKGFSTMLYYEFALNYNRTFGDHGVSVLGLFSRREIDKLKDQDGDDAQFKIKQRQEDWVGRMTYNYKERYLAEVNAAYNGSENFAPGKRFGFFPSATLGYRVSEEPFIKERIGDILTNLKLKYSYGKVGFQKVGKEENARFAYLQKYNSEGEAKFGTSSVAKYDPLYFELNTANPDATWEEAIKQNFGVEFILFEKLNGSVDLYKEHRTKILMDAWAPLWYVQKEAKGNIGETKNQGFEIELGWNQNFGPDFRFWVKGNLSMNENRIIERGDGLYETEYLKHAGNPINYEKRLIQSGYYQSLDDIYNYSTPGNTTLQASLIPGDFMFADYNADGKIEELDKVVMDDVKYPLNTYGFNLGCQYKGIGLNVLFYGVANLSKVVPNSVLYDNMGGGNGIYKAGTDVTERWTPENASSASKPSFHSLANVAAYSRQASTYNYQAASFLRLKNIELSYRLKKSLLKGIGMSKLELYANGSNLFTWTKLDDRLDPEAKKTGVYPMVKRYNVGLRASF